MSQLHDMKTGKRKYEGHIIPLGNQSRQNRRNHFTQGKTGFVPHPCSDPVNVAMAKRG